MAHKSQKMSSRLALSRLAISSRLPVSSRLAISSRLTVSSGLTCLVYPSRLNIVYEKAPKMSN